MTALPQRPVAATFRLCAALLLMMAAAYSQARLTAAPAASPTLDWLFDGNVSATARIGNTLYVGGGFLNVAPVVGNTGHLVGVSVVTGAAAPGTPSVNGSVLALEPDGSGGWFVSKATEVNAGSALVATVVEHRRADGTLDPAFSSAAITGTFRRLARVGPSLVVAGGTFTGFVGTVKVGSAARAMVALDPVTGALSPWTPLLPGAEPEVLDLAVSGTTLFALSRDGIFGAQRWVSAFDGATGTLLWQRDLGGTPAPGFPSIGGGALSVAGGRLIAGLDGGMFSLNPSTGVVDSQWGGTNAAGVWVMDIEASATSVYVGGRFTQFMGAARTNLAAVDLATGALTGWGPQFTTDASILAVSPSGSVFVPVPTGTVDGQPRDRVAEIDAAGHVTPWVPAASFYSVQALEVTPAGTLMIGTLPPALAGAVPRRGLAAFDLTTGALLPAAPVLDGGALGPTSPPSVTGLVADGTTLYLSGGFATVNGAARSGLAAVDTTSNTVLAWAPPPPVPLPTPSKVVLVAGSKVYVGARDVTGRDPHHATVARYDAVSGAPDAAWQSPPVTDVVLSDGRLVALRDVYAGAAAAVGELDGTTGQFVEWFRTSAVQLTATNDVFPFGGRLALSGDTVYLAGPRPGVALTDRATADSLFAYDRRSGVRVGPEVVGYINSLAIADGRVIALGGGLTMSGGQRLELGEIDRPGVFTGWAPAWPLLGAPMSFDYISIFSFTRGAVAAVAAGDALVVRGRATGFPSMDKVTVYPLSGNSVPANLRTQISGGNTVFSWDAMVPPPPGGYVIEGGFAAGQTAGALPVGNATSVALPMPAGPVFIRVRPQGGASVSNEIVAGCVAPPLPPTALTTTLNGINLTLTWTTPSGPVTGYTLHAGTASGLGNVATLTLGPQTSVAGPVPGGTFFARVTATNACGTSAPSGEVFFTIGAPDALPAAPTNLTANVAGSTLTLSWTAPAGPVTGYVLEAGSAPGLANIGAATIGANTSFVIPGVPAGVYYVRARAITSAGSGAPSNDVVVVVP